ncbi:MAG: helix-turn-helix domain-containing protein [Ottowia sp.]
MYKYTDGGLRNVWLANGYSVHETPYGEAVSIDDLDGLTEALCSAFVRKDKPLSRTEFRYLRSSGLKLSQAALGATLGVDAQTVARWEKNKHIPKMADKLIRLLYLAHANGNVRLRSAFETLRVVERAKKGPQPKPARVIAESQGESWKARLDDDDAPEGDEQEPNPVQVC